MRVDRILPAALRAAQTEHDECVRSAAIATLGNLGAKESIDYLREVAAGANERLRLPAQAALAHITRQTN